MKQAFEAAVEKGDEERIAVLIRSNENYLPSCFDDYAQAWLERTQSAEPALVELARLAAIARAVQSVFHGTALTEMVDRLQTFDAVQRQKWLDARRAYLAALRAPTTEEDVSLLSSADRAFEDLGWIPGLASTQYQLGRQRDFQQALTHTEAAVPHAVALAWPSLACHVEFQRGTLLTYLGRNEEADLAYAETLELAALVGRKRLLWTRRCIGWHLYRFGNLEAAKVQFERQLAALFADEVTEINRSRLALAACSFRLGRDGEAIEQLLPWFEIAPGDLDSALTREDRTGVEQWVRANDSGALAHFDAYAVQIAWKACRRARDDALIVRARLLAESIAAVLALPSVNSEIDKLARMDEREAFDWLRGFAFITLGTSFDAEVSEPLEWLQRARATLEEEAWPARLAMVHQQLGTCYEAKAQYDRSLEHFAAAARLSRIAGIEKQEAHAITCLGHARAALGDYQQAIADLELVLPIARHQGDPYELAFTLREIAACQIALGLNARARAALEEALSLGEWPRLFRAKLLSQMGHVLCLEGTPELALPYLEQAVRIHDDVGEPRDTPSSLCRLAICLSQLKRGPEAVDAAQRALLKVQPFDSPALVANASNALGLSLAVTGDVTGAIQHHSRALELQESMGQHRDAAWTLKELADCHIAEADPASALRRLEQCLAHLDQVGRRVLSEEGRSSFLAQWESVPAMTSAIVAELDEKGMPAVFARGLPIVDSFLARTLIEGLQERADAACLGSDRELVVARERALDEMTSLRLACAQATTPEDRAAPEEQLRHAEARYRDLEQELRLANPALQELISPRTVSLATLQRETLEREEVLLQFVLGDEASFVWAITRDEARVVRLAPRAKLRAVCDRLAQALDPEGPTDASFLAPARELYELLLAPLARTIESRSRWVVIPDDFLAFVPFDALLTRDESSTNGDGELAYLIREKSVTYAPSASFLAWSPPSRTESDARKDLLLVGDPTYPLEQVQGDELAMRPVTSLHPERLRRLERTRDEVRAIARQVLLPEEAELQRALAGMPRSGELHGARFDLFLGAQATKTNVAAHLGHHRLVHLAVHGWVDTEYPWFSGLVLSGEHGEPCSFLNLAEIASFALDAELVFLSACDTARGESVKSEGIKNAARAFLLAGAKEVVATQWTVSDEASAQLAQRFYEELFRGASPADALRHAKLELIRAGGPTSRDESRGIGETRSERAATGFMHPAFWAPYVLWGRSTL